MFPQVAFHSSATRVIKDAICMWEGVKTYKTYMALGLKNNRLTKTYILGSHKTTLFSLPMYVLYNKGLNCSKQGDFSCRQNDGLIQY